MFKLLLLWRRRRGKLWVRPTLWSLAAVAAALMAALVEAEQAKDHALQGLQLARECDAVNNWVYCPDV